MPECAGFLVVCVIGGFTLKDTHKMQDELNHLARSFAQKRAADVPADFNPAPILVDEETKTTTLRILDWEATRGIYWKQTQLRQALRAIRSKKNCQPFKFECMTDQDRDAATGQSLTIPSLPPPPSSSSS